MMALKTSSIATKLGPMVVVTDDQGLYFLRFLECTDKPGPEAALEKFKRKAKASIVPGSTEPMKRITWELQKYFEGTLMQFTIPLCLVDAGTSFQKSVWEELMLIPYGQTRTYLEQSVAIGKRTACRAVANAHGANPFAVVMPCHRVITTHGGLGGYAGDVARKDWLIDHEKKYARSG